MSAGGGADDETRRGGESRRAVRAAVVIPAAGTGRRMGGVRKQYVELAGEPILLRSIRPFLEHPAVEWVIVALPPEDVERPPLSLPPGTHVVAGGGERGESVRLALAAVPEEAEVVVIHDSARPLVDGGAIGRAIAGAAAGHGVVIGIPVTDTLKRVGDGRITETVDRRGLWRAQTPQAFPRELILRAHRRAEAEGVVATDDAALVERYGGDVRVVEGSSRNIKITTPEDLALAELLIRATGADDAGAGSGRG